ncbi:MAG: three-helix bundle dimerization domain-containing protein [Propionibacteriaceae bacterium]
MAEVTDEKIIDEVVGRVASRYPGLGSELIVKRTWAALKAFADPRIRDFLPVLVERRVVRELRSVAR